MRPDVHALRQHRRHAESVDGATRIPLLPGGETHGEGCGNRREGIGDLDVAVTELDQVVLVQRDQCCPQSVRCQVWSDSQGRLSRNRPAAINEGPKDALEHGRLARGPAGGPPGLQLRVDQLVRGLDLQHHRALPVAGRYSL
jgi:hypothetical protein